MKAGNIVSIRKNWLLDSFRNEELRWDCRYADPGELFLVLTDPFWVSESYVGVILQGSSGKEIVTCCVTNKKAFNQAAKAHIILEYK